ncbi:MULTISPECIES: ribose 5-phosphate isomerase A [Rhodomicrobium]|uniref:ribose 5-phosphate isomerase A n=1 Tax=Rhodomicrobium TaxID=1068 RepID=UPI000B4B70BF|nr:MULTISPECIES: ribose 5-phosphate isomerase A [Rhodomicrobium]
MNTDIFKAIAAERALELVTSGMKLGLGTGSTAGKLVELLAKKVKAGQLSDIVCVPTSEETRIQAERAGLKLTTLDDYPELDLTIDGADEIDDSLRLIKGGGGALLREKIVAMASDRMVVIADHTKRVAKLGAFPLPVEIVRFGAKATLKMMQDAAFDAGCDGKITLRLFKTGELFVTDSGNYIADCAFGEIGDPESLGDVLEMIPGVVEHGLFIGIADRAIIAGPGGVQVLDATDG